MGSARSKLEIFIEAILHGKGFQDAETGMGETGAAADAMATHMDAASAASHRLAAAEAMQQRAARELRDTQRALAEYVGNVGEEAQRDLERAVIDAKDALEKADREADDAKRTMRELSGEVGDAGGRFQQFGLTLVDMKAGLDVATQALRQVIEVGKQAYELAKVGAAVDRAGTAFENLSGGILASADNLEAMLEATDNGLSRMDAMAAGSKAMAMGLASDAAELQEFADIAVTLGRAFGRDATESLEEFGLMLANNSIPRLDTFGISSSRVRARMEELTAAGMDTSEAFKTATFEEARESMERLGDTSGDTATKFEQLEAATADAKDEFALWWQEVVRGSGALDYAIKTLNASTARMRLDRLIEEGEELGVVTDEMADRYRRLQAARGPEEKKLEAMAELTEQVTDAMRHQADESEAARWRNWDLTESVVEVTSAYEDRRDVLVEDTEALRNQAAHAEVARRQAEELAATEAAAAQAAEELAEKRRQAAEATAWAATVAGESREAWGEQEDIILAIAAAERDLAEANAGTTGSWWENKKAADEAKSSLEKLNEELLTSYSTQAFETMFGEQMDAGQFTEQMAGVATAMGIMDQETAAALVEASQANQLIADTLQVMGDELVETPELFDAVIDVIASGDANSVTGALLLAQMDLGLLKEGVGGPDGLYPAIDSLLEPVGRFGETMTTEIGNAGGAIDEAKSKLDGLKAGMDEMDGRRIRVSVDIETYGDAAGVVQEARSRGYIID